jgi:hypothetical protein
LLDEGLWQTHHGRRLRFCLDQLDGIGTKRFPVLVGQLAQHVHGPFEMIACCFKVVAVLVKIPQVEERIDDIGPKSMTAT